MRFFVGSVKALKLMAFLADRGGFKTGVLLSLSKWAGSASGRNLSHAQQSLIGMPAVAWTPLPQRDMFTVTEEGVLRAVCESYDSRKHIGASYAHSPLLKAAVPSGRGLSG